MDASPQHTQAHASNAELEALRALAAVMVFVGQMPYNLFFWRSGFGDLLGAYWDGSAGIDLFLAISGYAVGRSLLPGLRTAGGDTQAFMATVLRFLRRRFWRVIPAALVWLAVPVALGLISNQSSAFHDPGANLAAALTAVAGINNIRLAQLWGHGDPGILFPYWTLSLGLQFTLLLPVLALLRSRLGWALLAMVLVQFVLPFDPMVLFTRTAALSLGTLVALWWGLPAWRVAEPAFLGNGAARVCFVGGLALLMGALQSDLPRPLAAVPYAVSAVLAGLLVHAASFGRGYIMRPGILRHAAAWLGSRAYAIYLIHLPAMAATRELYAVLRPPSFVHDVREHLHYASVAVVLTLAAAELTYRLVEAPARRLGTDSLAEAVAA